MLLKKKNEERQQEIETYSGEKNSGKKNNENEEEKSDLIKKGMAAMNMGGGLSDQEINQKRKNFMAEIRDALVSGDTNQVPDETGTVKKLRKGKKQQT